MKNTSANLSRS